jgi:hypothetical protein
MHRSLLRLVNSRRQLFFSAHLTVFVGSSGVSLLLASDLVEKLLFEVSRMRHYEVSDERTL